MDQSWQIFIAQEPDLNRLHNRLSLRARPIQNGYSCPQNFACQPISRTFAVAPPCRRVPSLEISFELKRQSFDNLICGFKTSGGTARGDDLALLLEDRKKVNFVTLARQLVSREIFSFEFQSHFWIPMLQFELTDMSVKQEFSRIVSELAAKLDSWTLARWFTEPNAWLGDKRPADIMEHQFSDVLAAARADRFVVSG